MEKPDSLPQVIHTYQNHHIDSTRWRYYEPRDDDIIIATSYKSGTTWMQAIVAHLILGTETIPNVAVISPRPDTPWDLNAVLKQLETQQHRRFIKTHVPLDGLPYYPQVKYLVIGRDPRDVFMSLYNHHTNYTDLTVATINRNPRRVGPPLPPPQQEIHAFWHDWITKGWFEWETEGYPYCGNLHHTQTWWAYRNLSNIMFVHFNDLLADLNGEIRRIAGYLGIERSDQQIADIEQAVTFSTMKENAKQLIPGTDKMWNGGAQTFIFKGTNGRWKDILSADEVALYTKKAAELLPPDCIAWLEQGRTALI